MRQQIVIATVLLSVAAIAFGQNLGLRNVAITASQGAVAPNYRDPLVNFTSFDRVTTNTSPVGAGSVVWGGWADVTGNGFIVTNYTTVGVTNSALVMQQANTQRTNFLYNSSLPTSIDRSIVLQGQFRNANFTIAWPIVNVAAKSGVRVYTLNTNEFVVDLCSNSVILATSIQHQFTSTITNGQPIITDARATLTSTNTIRVISTFWKLSDWQSIPQGGILGIATNTFSNPVAGNWTNGVAITLSRVVAGTADNAVFNAWVYDNTATATLPQLGTVSNTTFNFAYAGSSTWVVGSPDVPTKIHQNLTNTWAGATFTTINGAVGGSTTATWLPGQTNYENLKTSVQAASGRKIIRIMLGSNDSMNGVSVNTWISNMQAIINGVRTWPVDDVIVDEIGVRLDGGPTYLALIKSYNESRNLLYGCRLSNAQLFDVQSRHLNLLSGDSVHQTAAGGTLTATNQSLSIKIP